MSDYTADEQNIHPVFAGPSTGTAGGSNPTPGPSTITHGVLSEIFSLAFWKRKQGYRPSTIRSCVNTLKAVAKRANPLDPEAVKTYLASANVSVNRKEKICQNLYEFREPPTLRIFLLEALLGTFALVSSMSFLGCCERHGEFCGLKNHAIGPKFSLCQNVLSLMEPLI